MYCPEEICGTVRIGADGQLRLIQSAASDGTPIGIGEKDCSLSECASKATSKFAFSLGGFRDGLLVVYLGEEFPMLGTQVCVESTGTRRSVARTSVFASQLVRGRGTLRPQPQELGPISKMTEKSFGEEESGSRASPRRMGASPFSSGRWHPLSCVLVEGSRLVEADDPRV